MIRPPCFPNIKCGPTHLAVKCGPHQLGIHSQQSEEDEVGKDGGVQQIYRSGERGWGADGIFGLTGRDTMAADLYIPGRKKGCEKSAKKWGKASGFISANQADAYSTQQNASGFHNPPP